MYSFGNMVGFGRKAPVGFYRYTREDTCADEGGPNPQNEEDVDVQHPAVLPHLNVLKQSVKEA